MGKTLTKKEDDYSKWYNELVVKADLAETSDVRGCMIIKPYGYALWEKMQQQLDKMFKETGHQNAYFPIFIPKSYLSKEADHVEGFAKECAVVTHYRLKSSEDKKTLIVDPDAKLEEEYIIRPTSETIIWETYRKWIQSYRDLPILLNQWANVVRWELRTRMFLRTSEFLWQEGHTAHAQESEAIEEAKRMLNVYAEFVEEYMGIPVVKGKKTEIERFAGALETYCIEALMQDGKALQAGTSHFLGQNFAKAFDVKYTTKKGDLSYVWATSWGVSTRLIGALIMSHSDNHGLVLPPKLAPIQLVIIPIFKTKEDLDYIRYALEPVLKELTVLNISYKIDDSEHQSPGWKYNEYELKGIPLRIGIGKRDLKNHSCELFRRDTMTKESVSLNGLAGIIFELLNEIQRNIYDKALVFRNQNTVEANDFESFKHIINEKGGFVSAHWDGTSETEEKIKSLTKATIRCIPLDQKIEEGNCILTGKPSKQRVLFARAY